MHSVGPDKKATHFTGGSVNLVYDASNGTLSDGNIIRSQKFSGDAQPPTGTLLAAH